MSPASADPKSAVIAADLGGTKITAACVTRDGQVLARRTIPTDTGGGTDAILTDLTELLSVIRETAQEQHGVHCDRVGIGAAGVIDSACGVVTSATDSIPGWAGTRIAERVRESLTLPTSVLNDVHAHALGESTAGAGKSAPSMLMIAVGTGVGGAFITHGAVLTGERGSAGSIGHLPVPQALGLPCTCGRSGHVEAVASGPAVLQQYRLAGGDAVDTRTVVRKAEDGDPRAQACLRASALATGTAIGALLNVLDPALVVLSGGMAQIGDRWWTQVREGIAAEAMDNVGGTPLVPARAGADAPLLGAADFAWDTASANS